MVDYNIAIPQQQLYQAPDVMQNAMRMQQMQAQNAQMGELARQRAEENALRGITADPNSPEYIQQVARISPKLGMQALNLQRQASMFNQQGEAARLQAEKTNLDISAGRVEMIRKFNADLPGVLASSNPAAAYDAWYKRVEQTTGQKPGVPEVYPGEKALRGFMDTADAFLTRTKPETREFGSALGQYDPVTNTFTEAGVNRFASPADTGAGAGTGPATAAIAPNRLAAMQATQARLGLPLMQPNAAGAGAAAAPAPAVGNAMGRGPMPPVVQSSYGAPIGAGEYARQQTSDANQRNLQYEAEKAGAVKQAQTQAEKIEGKPKVQSSFVSAMAELQRQREAIADLKSRPYGTQFATGPIMGRLPNLAPFDITGAGAAQARIDQVKSSAGLAALQELKQSSPSGASGLGGASDAEGRRLEASKAALSQTQGTADFNQAVDTLDKDIESAQKRLMDAYVRDYGELPPDIMAQLPSPLIAKAPAKGKLENRAGALNVPSNVSVSGW